MIVAAHEANEYVADMSIPSRRICERRTTGVCANIFHVNRSESDVENSQELASAVNLMNPDKRRYLLLYVFFLYLICTCILLDRPGRITMRRYNQGVVVLGQLEMAPFLRPLVLNDTDLCLRVACTHVVAFQTLYPCC